MSILALCAAAVVRFCNFGSDEAPKDPFYYMLTFYLFPVAALLVAAELQWQRVIKYFQFLGFLYGKGLFMVFIALLLFNTDFPVDTAVSVGMTLVGLFNIVAMCMVPGGVMPNLLLRKAQGKDHNSGSEEEGENSENDADEQDHLLPMTYASRDGMRFKSDRPERSQS